MSGIFSTSTSIWKVLVHPVVNLVVKADIWTFDCFIVDTGVIHFCTYGQRSTEQANCKINIVTEAVVCPRQWSTEISREDNCKQLCSRPLMHVHAKASPCSHLTDHEDGWMLWLKINLTLITWSHVKTKTKTQQNQAFTTKKFLLLLPVCFLQVTKHENTN